MTVGQALERCMKDCSVLKNPVELFWQQTLVSWTIWVLRAIRPRIPYPIKLDFLFKVPAPNTLVTHSYWPHGRLQCCQSERTQWIVSQRASSADTLLVVHWASWSLPSPCYRPSYGHWMWKHGPSCILWQSCALSWLRCVNSLVCGGVFLDLWCFAHTQSSRVWNQSYTPY